MDLPQDLVDRLDGIRSVGVITGAGVSAESGIQTYRGTGGLYDDEAEGDRTVEALSAPTLQRDPDRTWRVVADLARRAAAATPNPAHHALVAMEAALERFVLLTQNVDGLHQAAGSRHVIAIHGDVMRVVCQGCASHGTLEADVLAALDGAPRCEGCDGVLRPEVVLFGEMLPTREVERLHEAFFERPPELVIVAGTTAAFPYICEPVLAAARAGRPTLEVNPEPTALSEVVDWSLRAPAGVALPLVAAALAGGAPR